MKNMAGLLPKQEGVIAQDSNGQACHYSAFAV